MAVQLVAVVVDVAGRIRPCGGASHFWNLYLQTNADLLLWRPNSQTGVAVCWTLCAAAVGNRVQVLRVATSGVGGGVCRDHVIADVALEIHVAAAAAAAAAAAVVVVLEVVVVVAVVIIIVALVVVFVVGVVGIVVVGGGGHDGSGGDMGCGCCSSVCFFYGVCLAFSLNGR